MRDDDRDEIAALNGKLDAVLDMLERVPGLSRAPSARTAAKFWALEGLRSRLDDDEGEVMLVGAVALPGGGTYDWQQSASVADLVAGVWANSAEDLSALGHPVRLAILQAVAVGQGATAQLADMPEVGTTGQLHHHIRLLLSSGWLQSSGRGHYAIPASRVVPLLACLAAVTR